MGIPSITFAAATDMSTATRGAQGARSSIGQFRQRRFQVEHQIDFPERLHRDLRDLHGDRLDSGQGVGAKLGLYEPLRIPMGGIITPQVQEEPAITDMHLTQA
ncbi:MAG: hypothetical protein KKG14_10665 [Alphaproteobacteria bacterium]|nr:hypothetical protein [Alphaproteobacteria bacterium]